MQTLLKIFVIGGVSILLNGCATRTITIDSQKDVVRIGKNVKGEVYIYQNGSWVSSGKVIIPEGWYAGPMN